MFKENQKAVKTVDPTMDAFIDSLQKKIDYLENRNKFLYEQLQLAIQKLYSRLSERYSEPDDNLQRSLFEDIKNIIEEIVPEEKLTSVTVKEHTRITGGRKPLPENLPRFEVIHDISEAEKQCGCGSIKSRIGEEKSEKLQVDPPRFWVEVHTRPKYACRNCEGVDDEGRTVSIAPVPPQIIPKSFAGSSLIAHLLIGKFCDALPFYRQEQQFKRYDVQITRSTMCYWFLYVAQSLKPLLKQLKQWVLSGPLINADETPFQVLKEPGRPPDSKSYKWVFMGGPPDRPGIYFQYSPSRGGFVASDFLGDYKGYVQTDGYKGYNFLSKNNSITHFGCLAHVRRKFKDVINAFGKKNKTVSAENSKANYALRKIGDLYLIEREARKANLTESELCQLRQQKSVPILKELESWLEETLPKVPPQCLLGRALNYMANQWPLITEYVNNGIVPMDNNLVENAIRPFAIGRKNFLFSVTPSGAESSALFYSLIETAKANGLEPYKYLKYLFEEFPKANTREEISNLLPMNISNQELKK